MSTDLSKNLRAPIVVVNADDFGLNSSVNRAISDAFKLNLISSSTMLTNMPGFEEACEIAKANKLCDCIGVHLNLIEGQPLTHEIRCFKRLCNESGFFSGILEGSHFKLKKAARTLYMNGFIPINREGHKCIRPIDFDDMDILGDIRPWYITEIWNTLYKQC